MQFNNQICLYEKVTRMKRKTLQSIFIIYTLEQTVQNEDAIFNIYVQLTFFLFLFRLHHSKGIFSFVCVCVLTNEPNHLGRRSPYMVITQTITDGYSLLIIIKSDLIAQ
jgi:hypothetical protein